MKVVALISGGKDSCFNMMHAVAEGHTIVALANLYPSDQDTDEIDSYMYQTVGHEAINLYSEAMDIPLFRRKISGYAKSKSLNYVADKEDEVEDLYALLHDIKSHMQFDGVSCGAILSDYQRIRVESVCTRLHVKSLSYLWQRDQEELLDEMISCDVESIIIKTAAYGLDPYKHLGKTLQQMSKTLKSLQQKYGSHVCGEGGEFETFTLDCPLFKKAIVVDESEIIIHSDDHFATVGYLKLKKMHLEQKLRPDNKLQNMPLMTSTKWAQYYHRKLEMKSDVQNTGLPTAPPTFAQICTKQAEPSQPTVHVLHGSKFIIVTNICCVMENGEGLSTVESETTTALTKLKNELEMLGHSMQDICHVQIYVADMCDYQSINKAYCSFFEQSPPSRACIGCIENAHLESKVVFQMAAISCTKSYHRKALHVQSMSHWAPPNIGPFSQCYSVDNILFVAGTIALVPGSMTLIDGGAKLEAIVALDHIHKVMDVIGRPSTSYVMNCLCYLTDVKDIQHGIAAWKQKTQESSESPMPIFVVVNQLPKSAHVEWQAVGFKTMDDIEFKCSNFMSSQSCVKANSVFAIVKGVKIYSFIASLEQAPAERCYELTDCFKMLNENLLAWMETQALRPTELVQSYLFTSVKDNDPVAMYRSWRKISEFPMTTANVKSIYVDGKFQLATITCIFCDHSSSNTIE